MNKEAITTIFLDKLSKWEASQQNQTCGYLYEKTYVETMKQIEKEVLQEMITTGNTEGKKNFKPQ